MENKKHFLVYQITNKINNMIYIGIHTTNDINDKYMGSGTYLKNAIKKYKLENFDKTILFSFNTFEDMLNKEAELVNDEFIKRKDTYNIILGGKQGNFSNNVLVKDKNNKYFWVHKTDFRYLNNELLSVTKGKINVRDKNNKNICVNINDQKYLDGEYTYINAEKFTAMDKHGNTFMTYIGDERLKNKEISGISKNKVAVRDKKGNTFQVDKNDPRYLSGELIHVKKGIKHKGGKHTTMVVIDNEGNFLRVDKNIDNNNKILTGEYIQLFNTKCKKSKETKEKMSKKAKLRIGILSSQYGTCWITNNIISKKIKQEELQKYVTLGWIKGRKMK